MVVTKTLSYGTGVYIQSLGICKGKISSSRTYKPEIVDEVCNNIPIHNYLSWAFNCASSNDSLMNFCSEKKVTLFI